MRKLSGRCETDVDDRTGLVGGYRRSGQACPKIAETNIGLDGTERRFQVRPHAPSPARSQYLDEYQPTRAVDVQQHRCRIEVRKEVAGRIDRHIQHVLLNLIKTPAGGWKRSRGLRDDFDAVLMRYSFSCHSSTLSLTWSNSTEPGNSSFRTTKYSMAFAVSPSFSYVRPSLK